MKLLFHIGTEKTGTTAAQVWAANNREALARQGVCYSRVLGSTCHIKLHLWCLAPGRHDEGFQRIKVLSEADREAFRARLLDEFAAEARNARERGCHTFVISNELCHSRLVNVEEVQRAREFLEPHFEQIELLCGLRPQIDLAVSHASNLTKAGLPVTKAFFDGIAPDSEYYNYKASLELWSRVFQTKMTLMPIRRTPDVIAVIAAHAGIDTTDLQPPVRVNESIDVRVMAMMNAIRARPLSGERWIEPFSHIPRDMLKQLPCEERLQPGLELARSVQARFEESNRDLTNGRQDIEMSDLEPDWNRYSGAGNLDVLERSCGFSEQLAALLQIFNQKITLAELHNDILDAERHLDLQHPVLARRSVDAAKRRLTLLKQAGVARAVRRFEARLDSLAKGLEANDLDDRRGDRRRVGKEFEHRDRDAPREQRRRPGKEFEHRDRDAARELRRRPGKESGPGGRDAAREERRRTEKDFDGDGRDNQPRGRGKERREKKQPLRPDQSTDVV